MSATELSKPNYKDSDFPNMFADPAKKETKPYQLQIAKAIYANAWNNYGSAYGAVDRARFIDNRTWSNGKFDVTSFYGGRKGPNQDQKNPLMKHLDFDPVTEQSKIRDIVVGYLEDLDYEITATSINPAAAAAKNKKKFDAKAELMLRDFTKGLEGQAGQPLAPKTTMPFEPQTDEEIDMFFHYGGDKEVPELEIEIGNQIVLNDSDWKNVRKMILEDAFDCGQVAVDIEYDKQGRLKVIYCDMANMGVEDFRGHYLKRPSCIYYITLKTVQEVFVESNGQFTIAEMEQIARQFENKFGNPMWNNSYTGWQTYINTDVVNSYFFFTWKIPVMKYYKEELDSYKTQTFEKAGRKIMTPTGFSDETEQYLEHSKAGVPPSMKERKVDEIQVHRYYQGKWILNTEYIYDYGRVPFQARDPFDTRFALCPLKLYRISPQSLADRIKPFVKKIYMTWIKIDNEVARARPHGVKINIKALENISLGQGKTFTVKHAIEMFNETGDLIYSDEAVGDEYGRTIKKDPVAPIGVNGFVEAITGWMQLINFYNSRIVALTGINEFMDASSPNPNTPATVAQLAAQGTKHSMSQLASALLDIGEKIATDVSERIRLIVAEQGEYTGYADTMGIGNLSAATVTDSVVPHRFAIKVQAKPTAAEREQMNAAIMQSFASMASPEQGGLFVGAALKYQEMVNAGVNMKLVRIMMEAEQKKALAAIQAQKMEAIKAQTEANAQSVATAEQAKAQSYMAQRQADLMYEQGLTQEINKREAFKIGLTTDQKLNVQQHKGEIQTNHELIKATLPK